MTNKDKVALVKLANLKGLYKLLINPIKGAQLNAPGKLLKELADGADTVGSSRQSFINSIDTHLGKIKDEMLDSSESIADYVKSPIKSMTSRTAATDALMHHGLWQAKAYDKYRNALDGKPSKISGDISSFFNEWARKLLESSPERPGHILDEARRFTKDMPRYNLLTQVMPVEGRKPFALFQGHVPEHVFNPTSFKDIPKAMDLRNMDFLKDQSMRELFGK